MLRDEGVPRRPTTVVIRGEWIFLNILRRFVVGWRHSVLVSWHDSVARILSGVMFQGSFQSARTIRCLRGLLGFEGRLITL